MLCLAYRRMNSGRITGVDKNVTSQFDYILLSEAISEKSNALPVIERRGLADYAKAYKGPRFPDVGPKGTEASDHCPVFMELDI